ncbi:MAG: ion transporter [Gammaproteobacteria bacterium]|nr:ion transporter [Gammaproteobacteria bacterium]
MAEPLKNKIFQILEVQDDGHPLSKPVEYLLAGLILLSLVLVSLESVQSLNAKYDRGFMWAELVIMAIFSVEYVLRIWIAPLAQPALSPFRARLRYVLSFQGLIDLVAIAPTWVALFWGGTDLTWIRALRLLRILKLNHYSNAIDDLVAAIRSESSAFIAALYLLAICLFLSSTLIYLTESEAQQDAFASIPDAMWWSIITLTTVGYGDVSPITPIGKLLGALTAIMGVCTVALLTGIVANAFAKQVDRRKAIFEAEIKEALSDGIISQEEQRDLESLQSRYNISDDEFRAMVELLRQKH